MYEWEDFQEGARVRKRVRGRGSEEGVRVERGVENKETRNEKELMKISRIKWSEAIEKKIVYP